MANKKVTPLTDTEVKNAKSREKEYTIPDGNGLQLLIKTDGKKVWEVRYTVDGKAKKTTAGTYPAISLKEARSKRDDIKEKAIRGIDPIKEKRHAKAVEQIKQDEIKAEMVALNNTFEKVAREFLSGIEGEHDPSYYRLKLSRLENHIFTYIGIVPIDQVTRMMLIECMDRLRQANKLETARRVLNIVSQVYKYAVTREMVPHNIVTDIDQRYVIGKKEVQHFATITDPKEIGKLLRAINGYSGEYSVKCALQIMPYLALRPGNIAAMEWNEVDLENKIITIAAVKMKMKRDFLVPLVPQVAEILSELKKLTGNGRYCFSTSQYKSRPLSDNTLRSGLIRIGYTNEQIVPHGFRAMFSTITNEKVNEHGFSSDVIEKCLAHEEKSKVRGAYNRAEYWDQRVGLMQWWADYLDEVRK